MAIAQVASAIHNTLRAFCGVRAEIACAPAATVVPPVAAIAAATTAAITATAADAARTRRADGGIGVGDRDTLNASVDAIAYTAVKKQR